MKKKGEKVKKLSANKKIVVFLQSIVLSSVLFIFLFFIKFNNEKELAHQALLAKQIIASERRTSKGFFSAPSAILGSYRGHINTVYDKKQLAYEKRKAPHALEDVLRAENMSSNKGLEVLEYNKAFYRKRVEECLQFFSLLSRD